MDCQEAIECVEPLIAQIARKHRSKALPFEDLCQELRMVAWKEFSRFDASRGVPWVKFIAPTLKRRAIDRLREIGPYVRLSGRQRRFFEHSIEEVEIDLAAASSSSVDWQDLRAAAEREDRELLMKLMHLEGATMAEIAAHFGISESRVCQLFSEHGPYLIRRLTHLIMGRNFGAKAMNEHVPQTSDPVDLLIDSLDSAMHSEDVSNRIDKRINQLQDQVNRLKSLKKVLTKAAPASPSRNGKAAAKSGEQPALTPRLIQLITEYGPMSVQQAGEKLNRKDQAIRMAVTKSAALQLDDGIVKLK